MHTARLRALAVLVGIGLGAFAIVSFAAAPIWPVIGVAVATAVVALNGITARLSTPTCWGCGHDLSGVAVGEHGATCPSCGSVSEVRVAAGDTGAKPGTPSRRA